MTLYELTNDLLTLQAEQENADTDDQVFRDRWKDWTEHSRISAMAGRSGSEE